MRDVDAGEVLNSYGENELRLDLKSEPINIVHGQHRILALKRLVENDEGRWGGFIIPFVCMVGADEREEMEQFYIVNFDGKERPHGFALDLLKQRAESEPLLQ